MDALPTRAKHTVTRSLWFSTSVGPPSLRTAVKIPPPPPSGTPSKVALLPRVLRCSDITCHWLCFHSCRAQCQRSPPLTPLLSSARVWRRCEQGRDVDGRGAITQSQSLHSMPRLRGLPLRAHASGKKQKFVAWGNSFFASRVNDVHVNPCYCSNTLILLPQKAALVCVSLLFRWTLNKHCLWLSESLCGGSGCVCDCWELLFRLEKTLITFHANFFLSNVI